MIAVVTVRANTASELEAAALAKAAPLWKCHLDRRTWYLEGSYGYKLAILDDEENEPEATLIDTLEPGDQLHRPGKQWEATFRVGSVRA
jgi:hypothetical protein